MEDVQQQTAKDMKEDYSAASGPKIETSEAEMALIREALLDAKLPMSHRYRSVFTLRNIGGHKAIDILAEAFSDPSSLLRHEVAYCLGQMQDAHALPYLEKLLRDTNEHPMVRHEAGEALGAIGLRESLPLLEQFAQDFMPEVAETCQLAIDTIQYKHKENKKIEKDPVFLSIDPAPPSNKRSTEELKKRLQDSSLPMFKRYRALFALRDMGSEEAVHAMADAFADSSALLRHEIAYVLGQMSHPAAAPSLTEVLKNAGEHPMVRHEAAEALGAIATPESLILLENYLADEKPEVKESCIVALDVGEYVNSGAFEYANTLQLAKQQLSEE
jgi:deoxyhypusine monooxygenase